MGFSSKIKEQELLAAARHCCVCHRYAGVNVEVHHIKPKSEGGADTFENAICLCLDCHSFAGHYNSNHPKGTKYSRSELRKAKTIWHKHVEENGVIAPQTPDVLSIHYLICKKQGYILDMCQGKFDDIPLENVLTLNSPNFKSISQVINSENIGFNNFENTYSSKDEYLAKHPDASFTDQQEIFFSTRIPKEDEFLGKLDKLNPIVKNFIKNKVPVHYYAKASASHNACGGEYDKVYETISIKPIWGVFLIIENISDQYLTLNNIDSKVFSNHDYVGDPEVISQLPNETFDFPEVKIKPKSSVLVSLGLVLGEYEECDNSVRLVQHDFWDQGYSVSLTLEETASAKSKLKVARFIYPQSINFSLNGSIYQQNIHILDFSRTYSLNSHWMMGSCPHIMILTFDNSIKYIGELFNKENVSETRIIKIPEDACEVIITEIEDETTFIEYIKLNRAIIHKDKTLNKGETLTFAVNGYSELEVKGFYQPMFPGLVAPNSKLIQNQLVKRFIRNYTIQ